MACGVKITSISLRPTEFSSTTNANHPKSTAFPRRKFPVPVASATTSPESSTATPNGPPQIELEFIAPKPGGDGEYPVERATATSGEKLLRNIMLDNKIELYATYVSKVDSSMLQSTFLVWCRGKGGVTGKVMNCGGGGSCGTCIVEKLEDALERKTIFPKSRDLFSSLSCELEIVDGKDLLNERTATELKYLKKKPESWRLACQTIVGNKENSGKVAVQRLPQWKK